MRKPARLWGCILNRYLSSNNKEFYSLLSVKNILANEHTEEKIAVQGWVKALRNMKTNVFFDIDDGSCVNKLQVVLSKNRKPHNLTFGSSVKVEGVIQPNPQNIGKPELKADNVEVVGPCDIEKGYPFAPRKSYSADYIRQFLHMRSRTSTFASLLRIRHSASLAVHNFFDSKGFLLVHTPILTSNDCEGAGEVFRVNPHNENLLVEMMKLGVAKDEAFFDTKAFLTVSGQLHAECISRGISKVYTFGPTFRAENSRSRLHLSEFYMIEPEIAFVDDLNEILILMEDFVKSLTTSLMDISGEDIEFLYKRHESRQMEEISKILRNPFITMTYDEAFSVICKHAHKFKSIPRKEEGLNKEQELFLVEQNGGSPVFIINWPKEMKPFYMKEMESDSDKVLAVDLLAPGIGELCGGSLRESDPTELTRRLQTLGLEQQMKWYTEMRQFGNVPTGGFGMGFERFLQMLLPIPSIKDVIPFPRWAHNCRM
ncbi:hypothetical protein J437_LFUL009056 [Ladona fulva]|uniref:asparagine--tRNA ligase n=1 Tax=Ladona fulva TaxID=123851 RepID=A0A8K0JYW9_LADFU|nr:hypothetical protein J437_LFUL009056 [Ladona fulva]